MTYLRRWIVLLVIFAPALLLGLFSITLPSLAEQSSSEPFDIFLPAITKPREPGKIGFVSDRSGAENIFVMNEDGSGVVQITSFGGSSLTREPDWSPDGQQIAFSHVVTAGARGNIYVINADGTSMVQLTNSVYPHSFSGARWSPDGTKLAYLKWTRYTTSTFSTSNIYLMNPDGTNRAQLTFHTDDQLLTPDWSPSGQNIIFTTTGFGTLGRINGDGTGESVLLNGLYQSARYSPDGSRIVTSFFDGADFEIRTMDADGANIQQLTNQPENEGYPSWSPDGQQILFDATRGGNQDIYLMESDGSREVRLTSDPAVDLNSTWIKSN